MIALPTNFSDHTEPLPLARLSPIGQQAAATLADKGYEVQTGLTPDLAEAIKPLTLQPSIREYCPKDSRERFTDRESAQRWLAKERQAFLLFKKNADGTKRLAGYGWLGHKASPSVPGGQATFSLRISEDDQGLGLATPYSRLVIDAAIQLFGAEHLWLESWESNAGAIHVYRKLGFQTVTEKPDERLRPSGERVSDTRLYMALTGPLQ